MFAGAKGGVGTSTAAVNAAAYAASITTRRVLLLDLDFDAGSAAVLTGVAPRYSALDLIDNLHRLDESLLASLIAEHPSGLHVLPAPADVVDPGKVKPDQLRTVLRLLKQHYGLTFVDLGRPVSALASAVLEQADDLFLVLNSDLPSLRNAKRILPHLERSLSTSEERRIKVVLNRCTEASEIGKADVRTALELPVSFCLPREEEPVVHSVNVGHPIVLNGTRSRYCNDVKTLGLQIARTVDVNAAEPHAGGILGRLKSRLGR